MKNLEIEEPPTLRVSCPCLMPKVSHPSKDHRTTELIGACYHLRVFLRPAGLDNGGDTRL